MLVVVVMPLVLQLHQRWLGWRWWCGPESVRNAVRLVVFHSFATAVGVIARVRSVAVFKLVYFDGALNAEIGYFRGVCAGKHRMTRERIRRLSLMLINF